MDKAAITESYELMKISKIIYVEDETNCDICPDAYAYDLVRLSSLERERLLAELAGISYELVEKSRKLIETLQGIKFDWERGAERKLSWYLRDMELADSQNIFEQITQEEVILCEDVLKKYAIGIITSSLFIPELVIAYDSNGERLPIRLFFDFYDDSRQILKNEMVKCIEEQENFVCLIDDQLGKESNCSNDIISFICSDIRNANEYGTYLLLSSKSKQEYERFDSRIHISYLKKDNSYLEDENYIKDIVSALIKSNYSMLINQMKSKKIEAIEKAYNYALENKDIAIYLAYMAENEGITNFDVIQEWLELRERFYWMNDKAEQEKKQIIALSSLLGTSEITEDSYELELSDSASIRTFEEYDYEVNKYYKAISPGDIFYIEGNGKYKYFLLIGQECDHVVRKTRNTYRRKNQICILLPLEVLPHVYVPKKGQGNSFEKAVLGNFKTKEGDIVSVSVDFTEEYEIDDMILDLCAYRNTGDAYLYLDDELCGEKKYLTTYAMQKRYKNIQNKFATYEDMKSKGFFDIMKESLDAECDKVVSRYDYDYQNNVVSFPVRRICRLKKYTSLMNKMYSEHTWRQAFDTINLDDMEMVQIELYVQGNMVAYLETGVQSTTNRNKNKDRDRITWFIKKNSLKNEIKKTGADDNLLELIPFGNDYFVFKKKSDVINKVLSYKKECTEDFCYRLYLDFILKN